MIIPVVVVVVVVVAVVVVGATAAAAVAAAVHAADPEQNAWRDKHSNSSATDTSTQVSMAVCSNTAPIRDA